MKKVIQLTGLDCANCAAELEEEISKIAGVTYASLAFVNQKLTVEYDDETVLEKILYAANHFEEVRVVQTENIQNDGGMVALKPISRRKEWLLIALSTVLFISGFLLEKLLYGAGTNVIRYVCYAAAYFCVGYPVLLATAKNIAKGKIFDENFLMTIASIGAVCIGEIGEGVMVMLLYQIGETLQGIAVDSSRRHVTQLMDLKSEWATVLVQNACACGCCSHDHEHEHHVPMPKQIRPEEIQEGDILLVKTGEKIPVDGVLLNANAMLDTKALTGEAELRAYKHGDELLSGCINAGAIFTMRATRRYTDSAVSRILEMVENAASGKAKPEKFITKFARIYTPAVCALALALAVFAPLFSGLITEQMLYFKDFERWLVSALTFLVISCPCALIISVPLTYFSGIGAAAKQGILVKGATHLDALAKTEIVALDKTGTLTEGNFTICGTRLIGDVGEEELLSLAGALEEKSAHPIAKAFVSRTKKYCAENVVEQAGKGLLGEIAGEKLLVGNAELMKENGVVIPDLQSAYTLVYVAKNGMYLGAIEVGDKIRKEAKTALNELKKLGITRTVMLTGDNTARAEKIANEVGVYELNANLLPDEKLKKAEEMKKQGTVAYVGDGINDAPVMAIADVSVSMGKLGSAAAIEASDLVLIADDLSALPKGIKIARRTRNIVMQNIVFSVVMKLAFMVLGAIGVLPLWLAVFADVGVMLLAVVNSFRVRALKNK